MKRKVVTFNRIVWTGVTNFLRNASLAVAAVTVMVVTLTIILFSVVTSATMNHTVAQISAKINISIYLNDSVTTVQSNSLIDELKNLSEVKSVDYVSKAQALAEYEAENAGNKSLLAAISVTGNPLPASIQINLVNPSHIDQIQKVLGQSSTIQLEDPQAGTSYSGDRKAAIDQIAHATNILEQVGFAAVIVFAFVSVLIIFNTIQMAIFNRRDEIQIMRLLGASTSYIRGPFIVESIIYGLLSALISVALIDLLFVVASSALQASSFGLLDINYAHNYFYGNFPLLLTLQLALGIVIGAVSSIIATRRYLKFKSK
jgi:cell division transport system permease protein